MTDKTRILYIICPSLYQSEVKRHFTKKYKYIGEFVDIKEIVIRFNELYLFKKDDGYYNLPTSYLLIKEHKKEPINIRDEIEVYDNVTSRQIITYPFYGTNEWSNMQS
jgi:hypothetical protein